ncbi:MAG: 4-alpha-glucanotransferase [Pelovirga sp.]
MLKQRRSGILLHPTSLAGPQYTGSLGQEARDFIDFLAASGQSVWQVLPLNPTGYGNCPYSCFSAFAGNPLLINLADLAQTEDLDVADLPLPVVKAPYCDFAAAFTTQMPLLRKAFQTFFAQQHTLRYQGFSDFCHAQNLWLDDYSLFEAIRSRQDYSNWQDWPEPLRRRDQAALEQCRSELAEEILWHKYLQFVFFEQWFSLRQYAQQRSILIFGDLPIFVAENSADVWAHPQLFHLDEQQHPTLVAGVPPDYFSATGQRWGNPLYCWDQLKKQNYRWWLQRFDWNFSLFDLLRVDHFRGFVASWAIPANDPTAVNGQWMDTPGRELFDLLLERYSNLPIIAEDLGVITTEVEQLRDDFSFPGMKILQFAFDSDAKNPYLPHNHRRNSVVYTGTHDNNTTLGWWNQLDNEVKNRAKEYLGTRAADMPWLLVETAMASVARLSVIPLQDILCLDEGSRMNTPGTSTGNWSWRFSESALDEPLRRRLRSTTHLYGRDLCIST